VHFHARAASEHDRSISADGGRAGDAGHGNRAGEPEDFSEDSLGRARPARHLDGRDRYASAAFAEIWNAGALHDAERDELDKERAAMMRRDKRVERGTELDVAGAYNALFMSMKLPARAPP